MLLLYMLIKRNIFDSILEWLDEERIIILKGARQTGKTTLLKSLIEYLNEENKKSIYFSLNNELFNPAFENPKIFYKFLNQQYEISKYDKVYLIMDEFQYLKDPGLFLKVLYDNYKDKLKIIVSGSSSLELSKTKEFLTGRKIEFILERFDFKEFLRAKSQYNYDSLNFKLHQIDEIKDFVKVYSNDLKTNLLEYVNFGGYPEIVLTENIDKKAMKLEEIVNTYIKKDITDFLRVENISGFNNLVQILFSTTGSIINKDELSGTVRLNLRTTNKYLDILEKTFILSFVPPYFKNIRKEITKMKKFYLNDLSFSTLYRGLRFNNFYFISRNIIENFVYLCLKNKYDVYYYRTKSKAEIDFVLKKGQTLIPVEVKFTNKLKYNAGVLKYFKKDYKSEISIIITKDIFHYENNTFFIPVFILPFLSLV